MHDAAEAVAFVQTPFFVSPTDRPFRAQKGRFWLIGRPYSQGSKVPENNVIDGFSGGDPPIDGKCYVVEPWIGNSISG